MKVSTMEEWSTCDRMKGKDETKRASRHRLVRRAWKDDLIDNFEWTKKLSLQEVGGDERCRLLSRKGVHARRGVFLCATPSQVNHLLVLHIVKLQSSKLSPFTYNNEKTQWHDRKKKASVSYRRGWE